MKKKTYEKLREEWKLVAGNLYNEAYEENGPVKREIEDYRTDREYEARVIECAVDAYRTWKRKGKPKFEKLSLDQRVELVQDALDSEDARFGWYRGNASDWEVVEACLS
jgi:hypothetical protein